MPKRKVVYEPSIFQIEPGDTASLMDCVPVIQAAFITVLDDLGLTEAEVPSNAAFLTPERMLEFTARGCRVFALRVNHTIAGTVSLRSSGKAAVAYLERLAVIPDLRHRGYGSRLLDHGCAVAAGEGAHTISVGIIDQNTVLKHWYAKHGFQLVGTSQFEHLPFQVCFMSRQLQP